MGKSVCLFLCGWGRGGAYRGCGGAAVGLQWGWLFWLAVYVSGPCLLRPMCTKSAGGFKKKEVVQGCIIVVVFIRPAQFRPVREAGQRRGRAWKHGVEERGSTAWRWIAAAWKRCRRYCAQPIQQRTEQTEFRPRRRQPVNLPREANRKKCSLQRCSPQDFFFPPAISLTRRDDSADTQCQIQETNNEISGRFEIVKSMNKERKKERNK